MSTFLLYCSFNKRWSISYNIWHTVYLRNLQHNKYSLHHLTYILLPLYLEKYINCATVTLTTKVIHIIVAKTKNYPVFLHSRVLVLQQVLKLVSLFIYSVLKSLMPFIIHIEATPSVNQISHVLNCITLHMW